jgi:hypothetical protein
MSRSTRIPTIGLVAALVLGGAPLVMSWVDAHGVGYLGWTGNTWPRTSGPALITDDNGTATAFGQGLRDHLATVSN